MKHYSKRSVGAIRGPITVVASKSRRLTFVECSQEASIMLDLAKIADLVITMIDGEKGLELGTFEFINILQVHGFPRIIGVLSKLDLYKESKHLKKFKKTVKRRFWTEIYDGAKLFYLTGLKGRRYLKRETLNLSRFISVQKYDPLTWRSQHPYMLPLSTDIGDETEDTCRVTFSGYLRGCRLRQGQSFHIPGCGDFSAEEITSCTDPCPYPTGSDQNKVANSKDAGKLLRKLNDADRAIYAPLCDVGVLSYDGKDVYIKIPDNTQHFTPAHMLKAEDNESSIDGDQPHDVQNDSDSVSTWSTDSESETEQAADNQDNENEVSNPAAHDNDASSNLTPAVRMMRDLQSATGALDDVRKNNKLALFENTQAVAGNFDSEDIDELSDRDILEGGDNAEDSLQSLHQVNKLLKEELTLRNDPYAFIYDSKAITDEYLDIIFSGGTTGTRPQTESNTIPLDLVDSVLYVTLLNSSFHPMILQNLAFKNGKSRKESFMFRWL